MTDNFILAFYKSPRTVFTVAEISLMFPDISSVNLKRRLSYAGNTGKLVRLKKGIYAKDNFNKYELANKLYTPSYISLETVLFKEGVVFQPVETVYAVSYLTREIGVGDINIVYRKIKEAVLYNDESVMDMGNYHQASLERAFLDAIFIYKNRHFDNLKPVNWDKAGKLLKIYHSGSLKRRFEEYFRIYKENV